MTPGRRLGVLGGTFDPVHDGHVAAGRAAWRALGLDRLLLVPSRQPPHRPDPPRASACHRFAMVALAVASAPGWEASDLELERAGPSYSYDTLAALHAQGYAPREIYFLLGSDAFAEIATWSRFPAILDAAHFVVIARPGAAAPSGAGPLLAGRLTEAAALAERDRPGIAVLDVATPDISSTGIRHRAASGATDFTGLLPPAVAAHIVRHRLYSSEPPR